MSEKTVTIRVSGDDSDLIAKLAEMGIAAQTTADKITDSFGAGFKAKMTAAFKSLPNIQIDADSSEADTKIAEIKAELDTLRTQKVGIDISDDDALAKVAELKAALIAVGESTESVRIKMDTSSAVASLTAFEGAAGISEAALTGVEDAAKTAETATGDAGNSVSQLGVVFDGLPEAITPASASIAVLATALIPMAAVAAGVGAALAGMATAGIAGIGAFALAAANDFGGFTDTLHAEVSQWQSDLQSWVKPVVDSLSNDIAPALNDITPLVEAASGSIEDSIKSIGSALNSGGLHDFVSFLSAQAPEAIGTFTLVLENMGQGFAGVLEAFSPFISTVEEGLIHLSSEFADLGQSQGLKSFVSYVEQEAPTVGQFFEQLIPSIAKLTVAFAPLGDAVLKILTPLAGAIANMAPVIELVTGAMDAFATVIGFVVTKAEELTKIITSGPLSFLTSLASKLADVVGISGKASSSTDQLTASLEKNGLSASAANAAISEYGRTFISSSGAANIAAEQLGSQVGLTATQFTALEKSSGESGSKLVSDLQKDAAAAGITAAALANAASTTTESFANISKDVSSAASATQSSWQSATSVVSAFSGQVGVTQLEVQEFYGASVSGAQGFVNNIQQAIKDGYNPTLIEQILEAGPQQAAGILGELVQDSSSTYVAQVNAAQSALSQLGQQAVEESRLTQLAIDSNSDKMTSDLSAALAVDQAKFAVAAGEPAAQAVAALQAQYPNYVAVAKQFGITLPTALDAAGPASSAGAAAQATAASQGTLSGLVAQAAAADKLAKSLPDAVTAQEAAAANAAVAQAGGVTNAQVQQLGATAFSSLQQALALPTAVNQQTASTSSNALAQAATVPGSQIATLQATAAAADQQALALPTAVNIRTALTASNALAQAQGVGTGINSAAPGVFGAAAALAGGAAANLNLPDTYNIGFDAGAEIAAGLLATVGAVESAANQVSAAAARGAAAGAAAVANAGAIGAGGLNPFTNASGTGSGTFQGLTWVGEQGPELVNFDSPVQIINNKNSMAMAAAPGPMPAAPSSGSSGPAVVIQSATFTDQADLNGLMNTAAFAVSAKRL